MDMGGATADRHDADRRHGASRPASARSCSAPSARQTNPQGVIPQLFGSPWAIPYGDVGAITFMGHVARRQMHEHGITSIDYGHIAVHLAAARRSATPTRRCAKPMTLEDHQASRFVNEPLRLFDCCLFTDGGGAFIVTSAERARDLRAEAGAASPGSGRCTPPRSSGPATTAAAAAARRASRPIRMAGCTPRDIDVVQLYDAFTPRVVHDLVHYGFADWDEVGRAGGVGRARRSAAGCRATRPAGCSRRAISPA